MDRTQLYQDIAKRTGGDIYFGVVGPVRTGKSTFIKRFMDLMVLPNMEDAFAKTRLTDELPQSGAGRSMMTTQPKFVPNEAAALSLGEEGSVRVRMVDCVGYLVEGAVGHEEGDTPRMVRTPWFEHDIPFEEAAEIGTRKVITDHATIGVVVTTDGSIADIARESYVAAEERVIRELREQGKPFIVLLNSRNPGEEACLDLARRLEAAHGVKVLPVDVCGMDAMDMQNMLESILMEFPIRSIDIETPGWLSALGVSHWLTQRLLIPVQACLQELQQMKDYPKLRAALEGIEGFEDCLLRAVLPGEGRIVMEMRPEAPLFYHVLGEECGYEIRDEAHLIGSIKELVEAKKQYERVEAALCAAEATGYGMVPPAVALPSCRRNVSCSQTACPVRTASQDQG